MVTLWFETRGSGDPLVLLHPGGAGVDSRALTLQAEDLATDFQVFTPEQRAHGHTPDVEGPITFDAMAADTVGFMVGEVARPSHLLGYSDGGTLALHVALRRPDLIDRLVLVAGVFHREGWVDGVLDGEPPEFLRGSYAEVSPDGVAHYDAVVDKLRVMHSAEPSLSPVDLQGVSCRTLVLVGDDDEVRLEHALDMYRAIPDAELAVVPGTSHGLLIEKPALCNSLIRTFLTSEPVETMAPIRRA